MVNHALTTALLLTCLLSVAHCKLIWGFGGCPKVTVKSDFDVSRYIGTWYEIARYPNSFEDPESRCVKAVYGPSETGPNYITVINSGVLPDGSVDKVEGEAWIPDMDEPGKLLVRFSPYQPPGDYWVLATDYDKYSVVHSCQSFLFARVEFNWFLSKQREIDDNTKAEVYQIFESNGVVTDRYLQLIGQEGCDAE